MRMRAIRFLVVTVVMVAFLCGIELGSGAGVRGGRRPAYVPGELLVKCKPAVGALTAAQFERRWGVAAVRTFHDIGVHHLKLPADMTVEEALELYRSDPDIEYVEPNYYRYLTAAPNDTSFGLLWGLSVISAPEAWDLRTDCASVVVALIDSGVDFQHPDIAANVWSNPAEVPADGIDNDGDVYVDDVMGWDFVDGDALPMDSHGHGTHVAGTVAAVGNNARGVTGVCWTGNLMVLRVFDALGVATVSDIISAMDYARTHGAKIINASYAGENFSQFEYDGISRCNAEGILFIAAAGNEGTDNDASPSYPASYNLPNVIAVAATDEGDNLARFSNYGRTSVDVAAPGTNIYSTKPGRQTVFSDNFDDGISDWTVESPWGVSTNAYGGSGYSLSDSPAGNYGNNINTSAQPTNAKDLSAKVGTLLTFKLKGNIAGGDFLYVETSVDALNWTKRPVLVVDAEGSGALFDSGISGTASEWADATVDLGHLDGEATAYFRFRLQTNGSDRADGVYIDEVAVTVAAANDTYQYLTGTSMATPHVSGLAALTWAGNPALTDGEVKGRILNCVDRLADLSAKVVTRGRVNAFNSLRNLPAPPVGLSARAVSNTQVNLSWANTYVDPIGFRIERKEGTAGVFTEIADLVSNAASYSDTGLKKSTTYTYRMRAYSSDHLSDYSAEVTATAEEPSSGGGGGGGGGCFIAASAEGSLDRHRELQGQGRERLWF
jgi:subtilisin family serine protease